MRVQPKIYLAGPITGLSYGECTDWRAYVTRQLPLAACYSPMRAKTFLQHEQCVQDHYDHPLASQGGITMRDRWDVMTCDLLFVNVLGAKLPSIGTVMEVAWADAWRKPIVLCMEAGNPHDHSMVRGVQPFIVEDLDSGIVIARAILFSEP